MGVAIVIGINRETNIYKRYRISNIKEYMIFLSIFIVHTFLTLISTLLQFLLVAMIYGMDKLYSCLLYTSTWYNLLACRYIMASV